MHLRGLVRATLRNIKDKKFTQGASTLSMQLARNTYEIRAKSLHRKFLEIALTFRVEHHYSKKQIMAGYLNRIYFGVGAGHYGIEDAAQQYFGKNVSRLNEAQCAMIIGIIRGPHIFSPWRDLDAAKEQRDQVLDRMIAMSGRACREPTDSRRGNPARWIEDFYYARYALAASTRTRTAIGDSTARKGTQLSRPDLCAV
ncbi:MAG: hypothetical protein EAZ81_13890 [Verrucomicrobia bacterium]|nr:MAG: hypothetical protein EAZ81_13890 [Verrucomicrobiota bacterium]